MSQNIIYENNEQEIKIMHYTESDFNEIISFLNDTQCIKEHVVILNDSIENAFNEITIRNAFFAYSSEFYRLVIKDKLKAFISYDKRMTKYGNFNRNGLFVYDSTITKLELASLLEQ